MLYYDPLTKQLLNAWVDEHHMGQLNGCKTILALDMWNTPSWPITNPPAKTIHGGFFENLNWQVIEQNFKTHNNFYFSPPLHLEGGADQIIWSG